jgi:hypothetical protein
MIKSKLEIARILLFFMLTNTSVSIDNSVMLLNRELFIVYLKYVLTRRKTALGYRSNDKISYFCKKKKTFFKISGIRNFGMGAATHPANTLEPLL